MTARLADLLHWSATFIAVAIAIVVLADAIFSPIHGGLIIPLAALSLAGLIWLVGRLCRYLLAECKRRRNNPSLKRPGSRSRRSKNPAADSLSALIRQRAGDEGRGAIRAGSLCGSD